MRKLTLVLLGATSIGAVAISSTPSSAMPMNPLASPASNVSAVRWVCGPFRCWWRPNYYVGPSAYYGGPYGYYGGGPRFYGGWGWRRGWRRW